MTDIQTLRRRAQAEPNDERALKMILDDSPGLDPIEARRMLAAWRGEDISDVAGRYVPAPGDGEEEA